ncbi:MAG TPA: ribonuclease H-like domain-containing protein, partial [Cytophagaceae bacterium]
FYLDSEGKRSLKVKSFAGDDEKILLLEFKELLEKFNQDKLTLVAHNGKEFDFPYLCRRMLINQIELPSVLNIGGKKPWEINHIDTLELWKFGDRKSYTSLELLAAVFDIPTSKDDIDGSMVNEVYYQQRDLEKIACYCRKDVIVTAQLLLKLHNEPLINEDQVYIVN